MQNKNDGDGEVFFFWAMPIDVRKGCAFPVAFYNACGYAAVRRLSLLEFWTVHGKA